MSLPRTITALASAGVLALGLTACTDDSGAPGTAEPAEQGTITLGYLPEWTDGLSMAYLLEDQLTEMGYDVEHQTWEDAEELYAGVARGDVELVPSAWPENAQATHWEEHSEGIEDLGTYYQGARLHLAVPEYMDDVNTIEDLAGQGDRVEGTIHGIEPGAGLTAITENDVLSGYGLDGEYALETSSTSDMVSALQDAVDNEEDVVVTLWTPFWANYTLPVKALEDPEGHYGEPEALHLLGRTGFTAEFPELADWLGQVELTEGQYHDLEDLIVNQYEEGEEPQAVQEWLEMHPDVLPETPEVNPDNLVAEDPEA